MVTTILRGGLGNNLFMMAQCIAHAKRYGHEYIIPREVENPHYVGQKPYLFPNINNGTPPNLPLYKEQGFHYQQIPDVDNVCFDGYWQSHKYFCDRWEDIKNAFQFPYEFDQGWCAIHVRRGDYLKLPDYHPFVGEQYLKDAMHIIAKEKGILNFKVFSNDIPWCKQFFGSIEKYQFYYSEQFSEVTDLIRGSWCEHQILSNGTFALWQYYLNQNTNKVCVAPKRWFGRFLDMHDTSDIYPENAIIIANE